MIVSAPAQRQSQELVRGIVGLSDQTPEGCSRDTVDLKNQCPNGARIVTVPGDGATIREFTVGRLVIATEAVGSNALWAGVSPMLAMSGGRLVAISTPRGWRGWWATTCTTAGRRGGHGKC